MRIMKRALITGITGFVGSHLAEYLLKRGYEVYGTVRWRSKLGNVLHIKDKIRLIQTDIRDGHSVKKTIEEAKPEYIFHLAAQSFVPMSWRAPVESIETNVIGTVNLFEAVRTSEIDPKIQVAGSSEEYGLVYPNELPVKETNPLRPLSPYGVSKVAQDMLAYQYYKSYGLKTVITRAFNHTGPRRGEVFAASNFAKQIAEIEKGFRKPVIYVGNLNAKRDFTDVRDVVKAYELSLRKCDFGEVYNICSERARTIGSVLDDLLKLTKIKIKVEKDPKRMRPSDIEILHGDCSKFREKTGWKPKIPWKKTLEDLLKYWRERV
jgi:GDP-4-dehydro-6-deoxy-D-mannose reductase